jgi:SAM-dependent methyltransferase
VTLPEVAPANAENAAAWNGDEGGYWAEQDLLFNQWVARYDAPFFEAAGLEPAHRVLDIGCGTGQTTRTAAKAATDGVALGVDVSIPMIDVARKRAAEEGVPNASFDAGDAQIYPFAEQSCDVVISRYGSMFFADAATAFANFGQAVRPGGRLAMLVWRPLADNEWMSEFRRIVAGGRDLPTPPPNAPGPFAFADPAYTRAVLTGAGFDAVELAPIDAPVNMGPNADAAFTFLCGMGFVKFMLSTLGDVIRARTCDGLRESIVEHASPQGVFYDSGAWLVTARRT